MSISNKCSSILKKNKNLLALSCGVDSTALFFILVELKIDFDIAIVDYNLREESKEEVNYAKELAKKYSKEIFIKDAKLSDSNFEKEARDIRYSFFEQIIKEHNYKNLLTAHQLNDKLEWFLMQFTKGAGLVELMGFNEIEKRENYTLIRPLIEFSKEELKEYLESKNIKYFIDKSNFDTKYRRNYFRHNFSENLLSEFSNGIKKSFEYLEIDSKIFKPQILKQIESFYLLKDLKDDNLNIRAIDKIVKKLGTLLSKAQKDEILRTKDCVISGKITISFANDKIYIAPYLKTALPKEFKEKCRIEKIPPKVRCYLFKIDSLF